MVSTRNHPKQFPPPDLSPSKQSSAHIKAIDDTSVATDSMAVVSSPSSGLRARGRSVSAWSHAPSPYVIAWLLISVPLVIWDTGFVLGRPHTMPGGAWHYPFWSPYALYVNVDYFYGFEAIERQDGFTGAQGVMNIVETLTYLLYAYLVFVYGRTEKEGKGIFSARKVVGREAGLAALVGFSAALLTASKTILYFLVSYFGGWHTLKDIDISLRIMWFLLNGPWIVVPSIMAYYFAEDILQGLEHAAGLPQKKLN